MIIMAAAAVLEETNRVLTATIYLSNLDSAMIIAISDGSLIFIDDDNTVMRFDANGSLVSMSNSNDDTSSNESGSNYDIVVNIETD